jgi:hypothetical protein
MEDAYKQSNDTGNFREMNNSDLVRTQTLKNNTLHLEMQKKKFCLIKQPK